MLYDSDAYILVRNDLSKQCLQYFLYILKARFTLMQHHACTFIYVTLTFHYFHCSFYYVVAAEVYERDSLLSPLSAIALIIHHSYWFCLIGEFCILLSTL